MAAKLSNQRIDKLYQRIAQNLWKAHKVSFIGENLNGFCYKGQLLQFTYQSLVVYLMMVYDTIRTGRYYNYTWEDYKTLLKWEEMKACFACHGIAIEQYVSIMGFEEIIANDNVDTQTLINSIENITDFVCVTCKKQSEPFIIIN